MIIRMATAPHAPWWNEFNRQAILAAIEEAAGTPLASSDTLPDTLIATAQALGLTPVDLRLWIYDEPKRADWSAGSLTAWARRFHLTTPAETPQ
jgi:hypothetical protein